VSDQVSHRLIVTFKAQGSKQVVTEHPTLDDARRLMLKVKDNPLVWNCAIYTAEGGFVEESGNYGHANL
jgi:hypothetical protein